MCMYLTYITAQLLSFEYIFSFYIFPKLLGIILVKGGNPRCSLVAQEPVKGNQYSMEVNMRKKKMKTAIGIMAEGNSFEYLRT